MFLRRVGGQFLKKNSATAKVTAKNSCKESHGKKNVTSAFYYLGPVFDFKNFIVQAIAHLKESCTTQARKR